MTKIAYLAFTDRGYGLAENLAKEFGGQVARSGQNLNLEEWTKAHFDEEDVLVYVGATGIAVRAIAPHAKDKTKDPAVIVVDEKGLHVIPILSGHLGGANDWARKFAKHLGSDPVITTATDINGVFAVDEWSKRQDCRIIEREKIVNVSRKLLAGETCKVYSRWQIAGNVPEGLKLVNDNKEADIVLDVFDHGETGIHLVPRICAIGIGCRKDTSPNALEKAFEFFLDKHELSKEAIYAVASIDIKKEEEGLNEFANAHNWPFIYYKGDELANVEGDFTSSDFVSQVTGVDNVCERSAKIATGGEVIISKEKLDGITMAIAMKEYSPDWRWIGE